jgi:hypothetical protein
LTDGDGAHLIPKRRREWINYSIDLGFLPSVSLLWRDFLSGIAG